MHVDIQMKLTEKKRKQLMNCRGFHGYPREQVTKKKTLWKNK